MIARMGFKIIYKRKLKIAVLMKNRWICKIPTLSE